MYHPHGPAPDRERQAALLRSSLLELLASPRSRTLLVLLGLAAIAALRYAAAVFDPRPRPDELVYLVAIENAALGESPYQGGYLYLPWLAATGAWLRSFIGECGLLAVMRLANLFGVAATVWWSFAWSGLGGRVRLALAVLYLCVAEPVRYGLLWGNLSLAVAGGLVVALHAWPRRPLLAGLMLGTGVAIKPLAPAALATLAVHRTPERPRGSWLERLSLSEAQVIATLVAGAVAAALVLLPPGLGDFLAQGGGRPGVTRNVSLHRLLHCFGVDVPALWLSAAVAVAGVALVRRVVLPPVRLYCYAVSLTLLATPLVWSHTLLITLPMQVAAVAVAVRRWRERPLDAERRDARARFVLEAVLVLGAVLAMQLAQGVGGVDDQPLWLQGLVLLPPVLAPAALALYLARRTAPM